MTRHVCDHCKDTHLMPMEDRYVPCTRCPTPCQKCRAGGYGAFCEQTPCDCECHRALQQLHTHTCPECFRDVECNDWCDIEHDLGTVRDLPRGAHVVCDECQARDSQVVTIQLVWARPHDPGDGSECPGGPYLDDYEIRCENSLCQYRGGGAA